MSTQENRHADVQVPHPITENPPRGAPATVAAPKAAALLDAVAALTTILTDPVEPSSSAVLGVEALSKPDCDAAEAVAESTAGAGLVVQAPAASSVRPPSAAPAKTESVATSLPASIDIDAPLRQAFTARPVQEQIQLLDRIANRMSPVIGAYIRALFRHPPTILGQSAAEYYELVNVALDDLIPHDFKEVIVLKQIVDEQWKILTFSGVQGSLLNAAIAAGLVDRLRFYPSQSVLLVRCARRCAQLPRNNAKLRVSKRPASTSSTVRLKR